MKISTRLIAEEALRRGFEIDYFRGGKGITGLLVVKTPQGRLLLKSSVGTLTRGYGVFVANNKLLMGSLFARFNVPTPEFMFYDSTNHDDAEVFLQKHSNVVVKPVDTDHGIGVTTSITTSKGLQDALARAGKASKKGALIQQMCSGIDHRLLVVGDKLVAAAYRQPAAVMGDGVHTIGQLIDQENKNPLRGPGHSKPQTLLSRESAELYLQSKGQSLADVPAKGDQVQLLGVANLSQGGRAIDVTDAVHPELAALAVRAAHVAGLGVAGVDVMVGDVSQDPAQSQPHIIELNESPGIRMHHYPAEGTPRDVAGAILDQALQNGSYV